MYKRYFFTFLLGGSLFLLFTPIRAEAVPATSSATIQFSNQQTLPVVPLPRPPLIAAPDNAGQWHMTPLEYVPPLTQRLSQTSITDIRYYQLIGLLLLLTTILLIKKEATYYEKNND
ncbi:hypothetical protein [Latilactobacillus sakei]|uniref:LPXTG cell wall anchor domain-containing protein n=1 Tax=Latilactobacillus sakei TaxID=1599 RepID=A0AAX0VEU3_LATSK|nr:hypothetical protein [Latilactobacillus sakei]ASN12247.1 hypothetical protein B4V05_03085 [Latilactobacillus sakei]PKX71622.1 hypothetical protein CUR35_06610 [Latilactobacillus sakei]PKX78874.1 hypothetical protein CUR37_03895 [Latilactobacillus sakei]USG04539.1 hypothetical protein A4W87_06590 [Latilactobacillus sakei]USG05670.1 hypothetical protein A4W88_03070 [Latilactobacillus sakei]